MSVSILEIETEVFFYYLLNTFYSIPGGSDGKESAWNARDLGSLLGWEVHLENGMAAHSSILAWKSPWTEDLAGYSSWSRRVRHDWATNKHTHLVSQWEQWWRRHDLCLLGGRSPTLLKVWYVLDICLIHIHWWLLLLNSLTGINYLILWRIFQHCKNEKTEVPRS